MTPLTIGVVPYLLNRPLIRGVQHDPPSGVELVSGVPAQISARLVRGELDVALMPLAVLFENPSLEVIPGIGVACDGPVMSIQLFHRRELSALRRIALDDSSRSAALLTRVLLECYEGASPEYVPLSPDLATMLDNADAALLIGDPALASLGSDTPATDLGALWKQRTGCGFVFAMWAFREGLSASAREQASALLLSSLSRGEQEMDAIIDEESTRHSLAPSVIEGYLNHAIHYRLDGSSVEGVARLLRDARSLGLVDESARLPDGLVAR